MQRARRAGEPGDRARVAEGERHAHVDHVGDREEGLLAGRRIEEGVRRRLERQDRLAVDRVADPGEEPVGVGEEEVGELRLVGAAAALADRLDHRLEAVRLVQRDHVLGQGRPSGPAA